MKHFDIYRTRPSFVPSYARTSLWNMLSDVDDFFDRTLKVDDTGSDDNLLPMNAETKAIAFTPHANIDETKEAYLLSFDLPGIKKDDLKIDVRGRTLTVSGERKRETQSDANGYQRYECMTGAFSRSFTVPEGVDAARVDAQLADGVLKVTLPKSEEQMSRAIAIK